MDEEKEKRIRKEKTKLKKIFKHISDDKKKLVENLIQNAAFMSVTLEDLQKNISTEGAIIRAKNGNGFETVQGIMEDTLGMNKGYIYESVVADSLYKASIPLYYFSKSSGLEIDFIIPYKGFSTLIEAKAKTGNTKSSKTVMSHKEHYGETKLIKIGDYNISQEGDIITIPHYMTFVLGK